jgi:hypothetical protein
MQSWRARVLAAMCDPAGDGRRATNGVTVGSRTLTSTQPPDKELQKAYDSLRIKPTTFPTTRTPPGRMARSILPAPPFPDDKTADPSRIW